MIQDKAVQLNPLARFAVKSARIIYPCTKYLSIVSMIASALMACVVSADVFMRRVFNSPIFGAYDIVNILLVVIVFCSVSYVQTERRHVLVDTLSSLYPHFLKLLATALGQLFSILLMIFMSWHTVKYGQDMFAAGESMVLTRIPVAPFLFLVAFGYALFVLVFLVQFLFTLAGIEEDAADKLISKE